MLGTQGTKNCLWSLTLSDCKSRENSSGETCQAKTEMNMVLASAQQPAGNVSTEILQTLKNRRGKERTQDQGQSDHGFAGTEKKGWENRREALYFQGLEQNGFHAICLPAERGLYAILRALKRDQAHLFS